MKDIFRGAFVLIGSGGMIVSLVTLLVGMLKARDDEDSAREALATAIWGGVLGLGVLLSSALFFGE